MANDKLLCIHHTDVSELPPGFCANAFKSCLSDSNSPESQNIITIEGGNIDQEPSSNFFSPVSAPFDDDDYQYDQVENMRHDSRQLDLPHLHSSPLPQRSRFYQYHTSATSSMTKWRRWTKKLEQKAQMCPFFMFDRTQHGHLIKDTNPRDVLQEPKNHPVELLHSPPKDSPQRPGPSILVTPPSRGRSASRQSSAHRTQRSTPGQWERLSGPLDPIPEVPEEANAGLGTRYD